MERVIEEIAHSSHVGLFRRFEIMKEWDHTQQLAPAAIIGPDARERAGRRHFASALRLPRSTCGRPRRNEPM
jgi:hypothetical protein